MSKSSNRRKAPAAASSSSSSATDAASVLSEDSVSMLRFGVRPFTPTTLSTHLAELGVVAARIPYSALILFAGAHSRGEHLAAIHHLPEPYTIHSRKSDGSILAYGYEGDFTTMDSGRDMFWLSRDGLMYLIGTDRSKCVFLTDFSVSTNGSIHNRSQTMFAVDLAADSLELLTLLHAILLSHIKVTDVRLLTSSARTFLGIIGIPAHDVLKLATAVKDSLGPDQLLIPVKVEGYEISLRGSAKLVSVFTAFSALVLGSMTDEQKLEQVAHKVSTHGIPDAIEFAKLVGIGTPISEANQKRVSTDGKTLIARVKGSELKKGQFVLFTESTGSQAILSSFISGSDAFTYSVVDKIPEFLYTVKDASNLGKPNLVAVSLSSLKLIFRPANLIQMIHAAKAPEKADEAPEAAAASAAPIVAKNISLFAK